MSAAGSSRGKGGEKIAPVGLSGEKIKECQTGGAGGGSRDSQRYRPTECGGESASAWEDNISRVSCGG